MRKVIAIAVSIFSLSLPQPAAAAYGLAGQFGSGFYQGLATFYEIRGVATDTSGNLYVLGRDITSNHTVVKKFNSSGDLVADWPDFESRVGKAGQATGAVAITVAGSKLYVADDANDSVYILDLSGNYLGTVDDTEPAGLYMNDAIRDIAVDGSGDIYLVTGYEYFTGKDPTAFYQRVKRYNSSGDLEASWGDTVCLCLMDIALDGQGSVFVSKATNSGKNEIVKYTADGALLSSWRVENTSPNERIRSIFIDTSGRLFILKSSKAYIYTLDGKREGQFGSFGYGEGKFFGAVDIAVAADGSVYVADDGSYAVHKHNIDKGTFKTVGGLDESWLVSPQGIDVDSSGKAYLLDCALDTPCNYPHIKAFAAGGSLASNWLACCKYSNYRLLAVGKKAIYTYAEYLMTDRRYILILGLDGKLRSKFNPFKVRSKYEKKVDENDMFATDMTVDNKGYIWIAMDRYDGNFPYVIKYKPSGRMMSVRRLKLPNPYDYREIKSVALDSKENIVAVIETRKKKGLFIFKREGKLIKKLMLAKGNLADVRVDSAGNIFTVNKTSGQILKYDSKLNLLETTALSSFNIDKPTGLFSIGKDGRIYVLDSEKGVFVLGK